MPLRSVRYVLMLDFDMYARLINGFQPAGGGFLTAHELGQQRKRVMKISTGSKQFDEILGGSVIINSCL